MQPHIAEGTREFDSSTKTAERRASMRHRNSDFVVTRYVVVLNLGPVCRAELIDDSTEGISIQVRVLDISAAVGRDIELIYRGRRHRAEIRHITQNENGFLVGLHWKKL